MVMELCQKCHMSKVDSNTSFPDSKFNTQSAIYFLWCVYQRYHGKGLGEERRKLGLSLAPKTSSSLASSSPALISWINTWDVREFYWCGRIAQSTGLPPFPSFISVLTYFQESDWVKEQMDERKKIHQVCAMCHCNGIVLRPEDKKIFL